MKVNIHTHHPKNDELTLCSVGIHPYDAEGVSSDLLLVMEGAATDCQAIGEIGLDYSRSIERQVQIRLFQAQLDIAQRYSKGVVLHCVKAFETVMDILKNYSLKFVIFHGFIGSVEQAKRATDRGYYLSFGHRTFRSPKSIEALKATPLELLFFETDDSMTDIDQIYTQASTIMGIPEARLEHITNENFKKICG